jgi:23S rRNA pseudouridine955/2504/2580 synthase
VQTVEIDEGSEGQRLDNFLVKLLKGVPKTHVYRVIRSGEVRVNKGRASADTKLALGDKVRVPPCAWPTRKPHRRRPRANSRSSTKTST